MSRENEWVKLRIARRQVVEDSGKSYMEELFEEAINSGEIRMEPRGERTEALDFRGGGLSFYERYPDERGVHRVDLEKWIAAAKNKGKNRGGRPEKWDWGEAERALLLAINKGTVKSEELKDLSAWMAQWFVDSTGDHPHLKQISERCRQLKTDLE